MTGLIKRVARTAAVMSQPTGVITDGKPVMRNVNCKVFQMERRRDGANEFGDVTENMVFLVAPLADTPQIPGVLTVGGKSYKMDAVKVYRDVRGKVRGYRVSVAGGA